MDDRNIFTNDISAHNKCVQFVNLPQYNNERIKQSVSLAPTKTYSNYRPGGDICVLINDIVKDNLNISPADDRVQLLELYQQYSSF